MTKILLAADGSAHAVRAAKKLSKMAALWADQPEIVAINVHLPLPAAGRVSMVIGKASIQKYYKEESEKAMKPVLKVLKDAGFAAGTILAVGPIAETIVAQAKSGKFELICIGTRGMTATGNLLLGSVATRVLHLADMPVLTVR